MAELQAVDSSGLDSISQNTVKSLTSNRQCSDAQASGGGGRWLHVLLAVSQGAFAGFEILSRVTMDKGAGKSAFSFYRNCVATLVLCVAAFLLEKKEWSKLSWLVTLELFSLGLIGVTVNQVLYLAGLGYTSAIFASAMRNSTPVFTFLLAWICRMERVDMQRVDGVAKVMGCAFGILGSVFLSIYRGPVVVESQFSIAHSPHSEGAFKRSVEINFLHFIHAKVAAKLLGPIYLVLSCVAFAVFLILQAKLLKKFPAPVSCAAFMCFFSMFQLPLSALLFEPQKSKWRITNTELISIVYSGVVASGFVSGVQSWAVQRGGPVIVAAYQPLETTITAVLGFFFLKESLHMGSILGGIIVIIGLYLLIWGQALERRLLQQAARRQVDAEKQQGDAEIATILPGGAGLHEGGAPGRNSTEIRCISPHDRSLHFDFYLVDAQAEAQAAQAVVNSCEAPAPVPDS